MQDLINSITETIKDLPAYLKALVLIILICAVLAFAYITKEEGAEPTKQVGDINLTGNANASTTGDVKQNTNVEGNISF